MIAITDSHTHLNHDDFSKDFASIVERMREEGVMRVMNIGFDLASSKITAEMAERYDFVYGAVGVHPHDASTYNDDVELELERLLERPRILAVGEIGLDYYRDLSPRDLQNDAFRRQLRLAKRLGKPIVIHCRDAFDDVIAVLRDESERWRGVFHAFTGGRDEAAQVLALGFHIGIGGVVTFKNSGLAAVVADLPLDRLLLETDCPYLTPAPFRGKRNEPAYLKYVVEKVAQAMGRTPNEIRQQTEENFASVMDLEQ